MKHIKKFNESFLDFFKKPRKVETDSKKPDFSSINTQDNSLIPFRLFYPVPEIKSIVKQKINNLERDEDFIEIMDMIENDDFKKAREEDSKLYHNIGNKGKLILNDGRVVTVSPITTWEESNGNYDEYFVMHVDNSPLGYISYQTYKLIIDKIKNFNSF